MPDLERDIRAFVVENFLFGEDDGLGPEDSFLERGIIDSTGVLELVGFLERQFGVRVEDHELVPANLDSIRGLVAFIERKQRNGGVPLAG
jgi:acyl carrier protein